jgi:ribosomal protein S14
VQAPEAWDGSYDVIQRFNPITPSVPVVSSPNRCARCGRPDYVQAPEAWERMRQRDNSSVIVDVMYPHHHPSSSSSSKRCARCGRPDYVQAPEAWERMRQRDDSVIVDVMYVQFKNDTKCDDCRRVSTVFEVLTGVPLELPEVRSLVRMSFDLVLYTNSSSLLRTAPSATTAAACPPFLRSSPACPSSYRRCVR